MKRYSILAVLLMGAISIAAIEGIGNGFWSVSEALNAEGCLKEKGGSSNCMLFPVGDPNIATTVSSDGAGWCCVIYDSTLAIDGELEVTDTSGVHGTGSGDCWRFGPVGGVVHKQPKWEVHKRFHTSGYRNGVCDAPLARGNSVYGSVSLYPPCDADGDCSGSCVTNPSKLQRAQSGAYVKCEPSSGTVNFSAELEEVPRW